MSGIYFQSGIGGTSNDVVSSAISFFSSTSVSYTDVTNLNLSFNATGRRIIAVLIPQDGGANDSFIRVSASAATATAYVQLVNGSTPVASLLIRIAAAGDASVDSMHPPGGIMFSEKPSPGTHTYKIQVKTDSGADIDVVACKLLVYEI